MDRHSNRKIVSGRMTRPCCAGSSVPRRAVTKQVSLSGSGDGPSEGSKNSGVLERGIGATRLNPSSSCGTRPQRIGQHLLVLRYPAPDRAVGRPALDMDVEAGPPMPWRRIPLRPMASMNDAFVVRPNDLVHLDPVVTLQQRAWHRHETPR